MCSCDLRRVDRDCFQTVSSPRGKKRPLSEALVSRFLYALDTCTRTSTRFFAQYVQAHNITHSTRATHRRNTLHAALMSQPNPNAYKRATLLGYVLSLYHISHHSARPLRIRRSFCTSLLSRLLSTSSLYIIARSSILHFEDSETLSSYAHASLRDTWRATQSSSGPSHSLTTCVATPLPYPRH